MAKTITRDLDRRSDDRRAQLILRMSPEQRAALRRIADRQGTTMTALVLDLLAPVLDTEPEHKRTA